MVIRLTVKWEGTTRGLAEKRLSLSAFGPALGNLVSALRRIATNLVDEALGDRQARVGRFTDEARQLDIEITDLLKDSLGFDSLITVATPPGENFDLFTDLPEKATNKLLDAIEAESGGVVTNAIVRRYLESLPSGIIHQTYHLHRNGTMLREVSFGTMAIAQVPADLPYVAEFVGFIVGVGFEPGTPEVWIKTDSMTVTLTATSAQVDTALELRQASVRAIAVVQGNSRRLLILQASHLPINRSTREGAIFGRWDGVLRRLAQ